MAASFWPPNLRRVVLTVVLASVLAATSGAIAFAATGYWFGNVGGYDFRDGIPRTFTNNTVTDYLHQGRRVCAGQAHTNGTGFYGEYVCGTNGADHSYSDGGTPRDPRAHNGEPSTTYINAYVS